MHLVGYLYEDYRDARSLEHRVLELFVSLEIKCRNISLPVPFSVTFGVIYGMRKISMPKLLEVLGGTKTKFYCQGILVGDASLQRYGPSNWV
jgi:hypothetical protein